MASQDKNFGVRVPPQNIEAEMSLLGSLMLDKEAMWKVADAVSADDFYKPHHRFIYEAMTNLFTEHQPIDILTVTSRLKEKGQIEEIGGTSYLASLVNMVPTAGHAHHYATIVQRKKVLRDLISASQHIADLGYQESEHVEDLLDQAEQRILNISQHSLQQSFKHVKHTLEEAWDRIDKLHKGDGALRGVSTGFSDLDAYLSGLQRSDLIVLAARPSFGKTSLALDMARSVAMNEKVPVGIFSLEMSKEQVVDRLIAAQAGISLWNLRQGKLSHEGADNDFSRIQTALSELSEAPIFIDDYASPSVMQIRTMARRLQAEHGLGLVVVDYLQLIKSHERVESRVQEVSEISRSLKALAKELDIPVLAVSQLNRAVELRTDAKPKLSDLRESGSIEQDADVVMFIHRKDKGKETSDRRNIAEILIEKHRNGPTGKVELYFNEKEVSFQSLAKNFAEVEDFVV